MSHFLLRLPLPHPPPRHVSRPTYLHIYPCFFYWRPRESGHFSQNISVPPSLTHSLTHSLTTTRGEPLPADIVQFKPDVILAAECVYFEPAFPLLLQTLKDLLALCPSATVYFCFKKRRRADMQFVKRAKKAFVLTEVVDDERPVFSREGLFLYTITTKTRPSGAAS